MRVEIDWGQFEVGCVGKSIRGFDMGQCVFVQLKILIMVYL